MIISAFSHATLSAQLPWPAKWGRTVFDAKLQLPQGACRCPAGCKLAAGIDVVEVAAAAMRQQGQVLENVFQGGHAEAFDSWLGSKLDCQLGSTPAASTSPAVFVRSS